MKSHEDKSFAVLRVVFGLVWLADASFKWRPAFINNFTSYLVNGAQGQPVAVQAWINFWIHTVSVDPHFYAIIVALAETAIAVGLIFGFFTKVAISGGIVLALVIWTTAEGLGGPYVSGSTDIGTAIIYVLVFVALWLGRSWRFASIDGFIRKHYPKFLGTW
ncbi:MAG TPA: DoxX family membrane protein [Candidatus Kaiserbacteria bacterium]|nr:DoxX family membrane protein [Candidatus Kaiserbacteria bacterium]